MSEEQVVMSKSARKRANQKAREAAAAEEAAPPAPAPKAQASAKQQPAAAKSQPKAKAAEPAPAPAPEAKSKAKAKAKGKAEAAPPPEEPQPKAKGEAKSKAKSKAKAKAAEEPPKPKEEELGFGVQLDDGMGGDWEVASGVSKKMQKHKEKLEEKKKQEEEERIAKLKEEKAAEKAAKKGGQAPAAGKAQAKGKAQPQSAKSMVDEILAGVPKVQPVVQEKAPEAPKEDDGSVATTIKIEPKFIGRVIGPKGSNITFLKEKTGVKTIDTAGELCTIVGQPDAVVLCEAAIRELMEKGFMKLSYEEFKEDGIQVHPSAFPIIIGDKGAVIQAIKKHCKVEIDIPTVPKDAKKSQKFKVSLAGEAVGVKEAQEIVHSIVMYGHHEVTHPGFVHEEMEVPEEKYRFLIGSKGSEMRHIQNSYKVKVNIPRAETGGNEKVVIMGEPDDVTRAVKHIEKVLSDADQPRGRDKPEQPANDNDYDDDGPLEDWMKAYVIKRK